MQVLNGHMIRKFSFFIAAFFFLFQEDALAVLRIKGSIMDMDSKKAIERAEITITMKGTNYSAKGITNAIGEYIIDFPDFWPEGEFPMEIRCQGFYPVTGIVLVQNNAIRNFYMKAIPSKKPVELKPEVVADTVKKEQTLIIGNTQQPPANQNTTQSPSPALVQEVKRPPTSNLVFLIDVSASMQDEDKMPILKVALKHLAGLLRPSDKVSIVTYSSEARLYMAASGADQIEKINHYIDSMKCFGTTQGGLGLDLAYKVAKQNYIPGENNKVILITDGLFTSTDTKSVKSMEKLISKGISSKVALTVFSVGKVTPKVKSNLTKMSEMGGGTYAHLESKEMAIEEMIDEANNLGVFRK